MAACQLGLQSEQSEIVSVFRSSGKVLWQRSPHTWKASAQPSFGGRTQGRSGRFRIKGPSSGGTVPPFGDGVPNVCPVCRSQASCCGVSLGLTSSTPSMAWFTVEPPPQSSLSPPWWWGSPWSVWGPGRGCRESPEGCGVVRGKQWALGRGLDTVAVGRGWGDHKNIWPCGVGRIEAGPDVLWPSLPRPPYAAAGHPANPV